MKFIKENIGLAVMIISSIGMALSVWTKDIVFLVYSGFYIIWSILILILSEMEKQRGGHNGN